MSGAGWWQGLRAKVLFQCLLVSTPLLLLGLIGTHQARQMALRTDLLVDQNIAVSKAVTEALTLLAESDVHAHQGDLAGFEEDTIKIGILLKALAWGTNGPVFRQDDDGRLWKQWTEHGWDRSIGDVKTSAKIRQFAGEISFYLRGYSMRMLEALAMEQLAGAEHSSVAIDASAKVNTYRLLIVEKLRRLLIEIAKDAKSRRESLVRLQFHFMRNSFYLAIAFFLAVLAATWFISNRDIVEPIRDLTRQVEMVRAGDMSAKLPLHSRDEIGDLARSFNHMTSELRNATVSRDTMNSILDASPLGIVLTDEKGDNLYSNTAFLRILGVQENLAKGHDWAGFIHPEDRERVFSAWKESLESRAGYDNEQRFVRKDGVVVWTRVVGAPMFDGTHLTGYVLTIDDISEQKKLEGTVRQSEKMAAVGQLAGGIAHDLNNGLTPVIGYLDMILGDTPMESPTRALLDEAKLSTQRCVDVVKKLLNFSRPATQAKASLRVEALFAEFERIAPTLLPASIKIVSRCEKGMRPIYGNESDLMNVLVNLAVNARDAMGGAGTLTLEARNAVVTKQKGKKISDGVVITVTDTGKGIPPDILPRIFEPFFTTKPKGQGTGLGLSMVYNTLKDHEATIDVASVPGRGTTFTLYFPDPKDIATDYVNSVVAPTATPMLKGTGTVLFVDDEESMRNMGKVFLERMGYQVVLAKDGEEAIHLFELHRKTLTVTIMDMTMPKMTGLETLKKIKAIDPAAKVVLASGFTSEGSAEELIAAGAAAFLPKPYMIGPLAETLRKALGQG